MFPLAEMYQHTPLRCYEVSMENGRVYYREQGKRKWRATAFTDLDAYLESCRMNFEYEVQKFTY